MDVTVEPCAFSRIAHLRAAYRAEAQCQIVRDSILGRGMADPFAVLHGDRVVGYAGIWNRYTPGRLMEFFVVPEVGSEARSIFGEVLRVSGATEAEAQTNLAPQYELVRAHLAMEETENLLFGDGEAFPLERDDLRVRAREPDDVGPAGEWVVESDGVVVGAGGLTTHYNPTYVDIYMAVEEQARGRGVGSFLVQELRRIARGGGSIPAARCDPSNRASRRTLLRGGLREVGRIVAGPIDRATLDAA